MHSPLPVFHRPPSIEHETTMMRPRDPDRVVLTVEPPKKFIEPDSPSSMDHLIGPQSPDIEAANYRRPHVSVSDNKELLDRLLEEEPSAALQASAHARGVCGRGQYKRVFDYDNTISEESGDLSPETETAPECSTALVHHHPPDSDKRSDDEEDDALNAGDTSDNVTQETCDDSGKCSMENVSSQVDDVSRTSTVPSSSSPVGTPTESHGNSIARSRPSPRNPVTEHSSPLLLSKKVPNLNKNKQSVSDSVKLRSNTATRSSIPKSPVNKTQQQVGNSPSAGQDAFDPWEPRVKSGSGASYENVPLGRSTTKTKPSERTVSDRYSMYDSPERFKDSSSAGDSGVVVDLQGNSSLHKRHDQNGTDTVLL